jgi:hypothetical protein
MENVQQTLPSTPKPSLPIHAAPSSNPTTCASCASVYTYATWAALALVHRIEAAEIARSVQHWPVGVVVEVRRCAKCGASIARKR